MYRQYENPYELGRRLSELEAIKRRMDEENQYDIDMEIEIEELKDRIRFAWDDDEYN